MTITELKEMLEKLEKDGKGDLDIVVEDEAGFGWNIENLNEFDNTIFIQWA